MRLLLATGNRGKIRELQDMLASVPAIEVIGLDTLRQYGVPDAPEVVEDGETFEANAVKKAVTQARHAGMYTLADDSGLEVDALQGAPGVWSARYAGEGASDAANNSKLLAALHEVPPAQRSARFRCVVALADPQGHVLQVTHGVSEGTLLAAPRGQGGFGYDPLFQPAGHTRSMAELAPHEKHAISHRGHAMQQMRTCILSLGRRNA